MGWWGRDLDREEKPLDMLKEDYPDIRWLKATEFGRHQWGLDRDGKIVLALVAHNRQTRNCVAKLIGEEMYPYYFDCPQSVLDASSDGNEKWRAKVREQLAETAANRAKITKLTVGDRVRFEEGWRVNGHSISGDEAEVISVRPLVVYHKQYGRIRAKQASIIAI